MSLVTECIEAIMAMTGDASVRLIPPPSEPTAAAMTAETTGYTIYLIDGGSAALGAEVFGHLTGVLGADMAMTVSALPIVTAKNLLAAGAATMSAEALSRFVERIDAADAAMAAVLVPSKITSRLDVSAAMTVAVLQAQTFVDRLGAVMQMTAAVEWRKIDLADATMAMSAAMLGAARFVQLIGAEAAAMTADALTGLRVRQTLAATPGVMVAAIADVLHATDTLDAFSSMSASTLDDQQGGSSAWTAPTDSMAMARYALPRFEAVAAGAAGVLFATAQGIAQRGGADDLGEPIDAFARMGLTDFKSEAVKYADNLYVTFSSNAGLSIDVGETSSGVEVTYNYPSNVTSAAALGPDRIQVGRGVECRYRRYTIRNVDGGTLSLRGFRAVLSDMKRRF